MIFAMVAKALRTVTDDAIRTHVREYMAAYPDDIPALVEKAGRLYTIVSEEAVRHGREIYP